MSDSQPIRHALDRQREVYRQRRRQSHQEAHADADSLEAPPVLDHNFVTSNEPTLITTDDALAELIDHVRQAGAFGYDTEFIGEHTYHPQICLIQVGTTDRVSLIDPLAELDLMPFWSLLVDEEVEKIVHAGLQDLEPAIRFVGRPPQRVFDTQIAAAFIGLAYPMGQVKLVEQMTGADMGQGLKFSQWDQRPLSAVQRQYAANDVRYLPLLRRRMAEQLEAADRTAWVIEECEQLALRAEQHFTPSTRRMRVRGMESLTPRQRVVARALLSWREMAAKEHDVPPRSLLKDGVVMSLVRHPVNNVPALAKVRGLPTPIAEAYGQQILDLLRDARQAPIPADDAEPPRDRYTHRRRVDQIFEAVQQRCQEANIASEIVTSKRDLTQMIHRLTNGQPVDDMRLTQGWRRELLGEILTPLLGETGK